MPSSGEQSHILFLNTSSLGFIGSWYSKQTKLGLLSLPIPTRTTTASPSPILLRFCPIQDEPAEVCSRPCRPCLCTHPSRFQPLSGRSASKEFADPRSRVCGVSPGEQFGSRARPQYYLHTATPAREGKTKSPGQAGHSHEHSLLTGTPLFGITF